MERCERCGNEAIARIMSMFNTEMICLDCKEAEKKDPRYEQAVKAEMEACRQGDYRFPGIGRFT